MATLFIVGDLDLTCISLCSFNTKSKQALKLKLTEFIITVISGNNYLKRVALDSKNN